MKLTDIKNPFVQDSSKPLFIKIGPCKAKIVGYTPEINYGGSIGVQPAYWHALIEGDKPGYEKCVFDAEIL